MIVFCACAKCVTSVTHFETIRFHVDGRRAHVSLSGTLLLRLPCTGFEKTAMYMYLWGYYKVSAERISMPKTWEGVENVELPISHCDTRRRLVPTLSHAFSKFFHTGISYHRRMPLRELNCHRDDVNPLSSHWMLLLIRRENETQAGTQSVEPRSYNARRIPCV